MKLRHFLPSKLALILGLTLGATAAYAAGVYTNGLPLMGGLGQTYQLPGNTINGKNVNPTLSYAKSHLGGYETVPFDTGLANGAYPQTVAATAFQAAAISAGMAANTASATSGAATLNTLIGTITSESLTTAAGSTYTLTLTNSTVTASSVVQASVYPKTNTAGKLSIQSITPSSGSVVIVVKNNGTAALNGTLVIPFQVAAN